jgi:hypothetical protein
MNTQLCLYVDRFEPKSVPLALAPTLARAVYVVEGALAVRAGDGARTIATLGTNSGAAICDDRALGGGSLAAKVLRWELTRGADTPPRRLGADSRLLLAAPLVLDPAQACLLRCDRVDFPPGGEALLHTHQGGGIRCLLAGSIRIETLGASHAYGPLGAWFEAGPDPVHAVADAQVPSAFARAMVLPRALLGGHSSIKYVRPEDIGRPKSQRYQIFVDEPFEAAS